MASVPRPYPTDPTPLPVREEDRDPVLSPVLDDLLRRELVLRNVELPLAPGLWRLNGVLVRASRLLARLSQEELAARMETSHQTLSRMEAGHVYASEGYVRRLASALLGDAVRWRELVTRSTTTLLLEEGYDPEDIQERATYTMRSHRLTTRAS